ncbi:type II secretion system protein [Curvibacter sp. APW13]|uniref:pilin n=1 Tax=Curvibacter sp. APW13 TaxID=3077236 RepID=UPI0028DF8F9E|nr:type II secretion system protein [Curvibacter sp. APW13]MDT8990222.1 type II secretion system protein [Curvibacter sp. APW13]
MKRTQQGFTLIELVMVIVILGVLAAVAVPKFVDLSSDAKTAALEGVAGGITSASSVNYAARSVTTGNGSATANVACQTAAGNILQGGLPTGYTLSGTVSATVGTATACTLTQTSTNATATATIISIN